MFIMQPRDERQEKHHDRASTFYKLVLRWQKEKHGAHGRNSRLAAIGLPEAVRGNAAQAHVLRFIMEALRDGSRWKNWRRRCES